MTFEQLQQETAKRNLSFWDVLHELETMGNAIEFKQWLPADPSAAFMVCIGAGPWKYPRRRKIQMLGLEILGRHDLSELHDVRAFPLAWQNQYVNKLAESLRRDGVTMKKFCGRLRLGTPGERHYARGRLYAACGVTTSPKVLGLFCRDHLQIPSFPIDRHVRRRLEALSLPTDEFTLLDYCAVYRVDPLPIARFLVHNQLDRGNPDWSKWPAEAAPEV